MIRNTNKKAVAALALGAGLLAGGVALNAAQSNGGAAQVGARTNMMQGCQEMMGGMMGMMQGMSCCAPKGGQGGASQAAEAEQDKDTQRATVTIRDGYEPATISAKAGKPLELTFHSKSDGCANAVSIPALDKKLTLKNGGKTTVTFTPQKGTTSFACAMGMYRGKVVAN